MSTHRYNGITVRGICLLRRSIWGENHEIVVLWNRMNIPDIRKSQGIVNLVYN